MGLLNDILNTISTSANKTMKPMQPAIFLDRDGVINEDCGSMHRVEDFIFIDGVISSLRTMSNQGYLLIVITNQPGIAQGHYTADDFRHLNEWMLATLMQHGVRITAVYHCPHSSDDSCSCRKPAPGMILRAAREQNVDIGRSWMVGDRLSDMEAARDAGIRNLVLVRTGQFELEGAGEMPYFVRQTLSDVIPFLIQDVSN